jgi:hypothetical protein
VAPSYRGAVSEARTLWEEGHEPGRRVVALGLALALTAAVLDVGVAGRLGLLFDLAFVGICLTVALLVRSDDFFTVGVLPPLIMVAVLALVGLWDLTALSASDSGLASGVVAALASHAVALGVGYAGCLLCLAVRERTLHHR